MLDKLRLHMDWIFSSSCLESVTESPFRVPPNWKASDLQQLARTHEDRYDYVFEVHIAVQCKYMCMYIYI
jgi:hypothetical protein